MCINLFFKTLFWLAAKHHVSWTPISSTCFCLPPNRQYNWQHFIYYYITKPKLFSHICCITDVKTWFLSLKISWNVIFILMTDFWLKLLFTPPVDREKWRFSLSWLYSMKQIASDYGSLHSKLFRCSDYICLTVSSFIFHRLMLQWTYSRHYAGADFSTLTFCHISLLQTWHSSFLRHRFFLQLFEPRPATTACVKDIWTRIKANVRCFLFHIGSLFTNLCSILEKHLIIHGL